MGLFSKMATFFEDSMNASLSEDEKLKQAWRFYHKKQYEKAFKLLAPFADKGDIQVQEALGNMYFEGNGVKKDYVRAFELFKNIAEQDVDPEKMLDSDISVMFSKFKLATMYEFGLEVEKDAMEAIKWYQKTAEQGFCEALLHIGNMYMTGKGVKQDDVQAFEWTKKSAEAGDALAAFNLGLMYENGRGVERDCEKAFRWYREAAWKKLLQAQFNLGICYYKGLGVEQDFKQAEHWFGKAFKNTEYDYLLPYVLDDKGYFHIVLE